MPYNYSAPYSSGTTTAESAQNTGLGTASNILASDVSKTQNYPSDISGSLQGPATANYTQNVGYTPMQTVKTPDYVGSNSMQSIGTGLAGGDYDRLEQGLASNVNALGAQRQVDVANDYGGRGLYGSVGGGLMSGAQGDVQQATQQALVDAATQRYNLQLQNQQQQIGQNQALASSGLANADAQNAYNESMMTNNMSQNQNAFLANSATADQQNAYNQAQLGWNVAQDQAGIDFQNAQAQAANQYIGDQQTWQNNIDQTNFTNALALAGQSSPAAAANQNYDAAQTSALYGGIGQLAGGLMGSYDTSGNSGWNFTDIGDTISGWF